MYEQSARLNAYYRESDPARRRKMLDELSMMEADDGANLYRLRLWEVRHGKTKSTGGEVDRYLFQFVSLVQVYRSARMFRRSAVREIKRLMKDMLWSEAEAYGEAGERALYWELRNAAARFFKTCEGAGYNRALFGLVASGDAGRQDRICREVWQMTYGLAERTGMAEELRIWSRAVVDAYAQFDGSGPERLEAYKKRQ